MGLAPHVWKDGSVEGERVKLVACDHCGERFVYLLTRKIDSLGTHKLAAGRARAERKLDEALQREHDNVPCPACGRYQRWMVAAMQASAKSWLTLSLSIFIAIVVGHVLREPGHRYVSPLGIAFIAAVTIAVVLAIVNWLRVRNPNGSADKRARQPEIGPPRALLADGVAVAMTAGKLDPLSSLKRPKPKVPKARSASYLADGVVILLMTAAIGYLARDRLRNAYDAWAEPTAMNVSLDNWPAGYAGQRHVAVTGVLRPSRSTYLESAGGAERSRGLGYAYVPLVTAAQVHSGIVAAVVVIGPHPMGELESHVRQRAAGGTVTVSGRISDQSGPDHVPDLELAPGAIFVLDGKPPRVTRDGIVAVVLLAALAVSGLWYIGRHLAGQRPVPAPPPDAPVPQRLAQQ